MTSDGINDALAKWLLDQYPSRELLTANGEGQDVWLTPPARLSFPHLTKPQKIEGSAGEPKYGASLLFPVGADAYLRVLFAAHQSVRRARFGDNPKGQIRSPFRRQSEKSYEGYEYGGRFITASSQFKPSIYDEQRRVVADDDPRIYPGVWVRGKVRCYAYDAGGNRGVAFGLVSLQRLADDKPFATGAVDPAEGFDDVKAVPEHLRVSSPASGDFDRDEIPF